MDGSKYSMDIYKSVKISIGTVMKNPLILKFVSDHLKTKKICKLAIKKLPFVIRYIPDQYEAQQMSNFRKWQTLNSVPDCYKS